jgi:hypothetical protein
VVFRSISRRITEQHLQKTMPSAHNLWSFLDHILFYEYMHKTQFKHCYHVSEKSVSVTGYSTRTSQNN